VWTIEFTKQADKRLEKIATKEAERIVAFLKNRVAASVNPRDLGAALSGAWASHWRYRVGDYRIICKIEDEVVTVLVVELGHRREIYR
jgi:mRNA interferase RelE/StbE